jgi:glycosyltransferase involved in cell wall biosynthesis
MAGTWRFRGKKNGKKQVWSTLTGIETIEPSLSHFAEQEHYMMYKDILEKKFGEGQGIVWDNTWQCHSYLSCKNFPKMKMLHTQHGALEKSAVNLQDVISPRFIGISKPHSLHMSSILKIPVRYIHNGIPLHNELSKEDAKNDQEADIKQYLLSLNRITPEKGIEDAIDLAIETESQIKVVGDTRFSPSDYVKKILEKCQNSNGYAEYYGLVSNDVKCQMLKNCKAVIACPKPYWMEAFGLYAIEANAYGKPVLALKNGGLNDIVVHGVNGFLADTPEKLRAFVDKLNHCTPAACRRRVEEMFTDEIMTNNYLAIFEKVLEDDPQYLW